MAVEVAFLMLVMLVVTACTVGAPPPHRSDPDATTTTSSGAATALPCDAGRLPTRRAGRLTWAARIPGRVPWTVGDPRAGRGFEAAVAAEVSQRLGFEPDRRDWIASRWDTMSAPGQKGFDIGFDQVVVNGPRGAMVDFSSAYYDIRQAVVVLESTASVRKASSVADLRALRLGARRDSAALEAITATIRPSRTPQTYPVGSDDGIRALREGDIDALVLDVPTAYFLVSTALPGSRIIGTLPQTAAEPERYAFVLAKGSPLTACVSQVVRELHDDGTLAGLERTWLEAEAPELS